MAKEALIMDIDAKFLQNLKSADAALSAAAKNASNLTNQFVRMVSGSGGFSTQMQQIAAGLAKLGGMNKVDLSSGLAKINTTSRTSADAVHLLTENMRKLTEEYRKLEHGTAKNSSTKLRITDEKDLQNIGKLRQAITNINTSLGNKSRKKPLSLTDTNALVAQRDLYKRIIAELNSTDSKRTKHVASEINAQIREQKKVAQAAKASADAYRASTPKRAISFANQAKSLEQLKQAYKYLEIARDRINPKTDNGRKQIGLLNQKLSETKRQIDEISGSTSKMHGMLDRIGPLMAAVFSVQALSKFMNKLITVRGEFEMHHRSLQVLLKSRAQADVLWRQTTELALKSPFTVKQLVVATKQLAAYRVEAHKLHATTKMLADISAGLGVEMSRLILAFGQVKAAGFLRGTELRQFTEAGVNMLDELSAYYTNIEGKTVTVAEVFDRITKRMVLFQDVENVLTNITSAGGIFFNMQEEQSVTLRGRISNLKDSVQLMMNDIGESSSGVLSFTVDFMRTLVENWETISKILSPVVSLWAIYTLGVKTNTAAIYGNVAASKASIFSMSGLRTATAAVSTGFKAAATSAKTFFASIGPLGWAMLAIEGIVAMVSEYSVDLSEINKEIGKLASTAGSISTKFSFAVDKEDFKAQKTAIREMIDFAERELLLKITPTIDLDKDNLNTDELVQQMADIQTQINNQLSLNRVVQSGIEERESAIFSDDISKDVEQYEKLINEQYNRLVGMRNKLLGELTNLNRSLTQEEADLLSKLKELEMIPGESLDSHYRRLMSLIHDENGRLTNEFTNMYRDITGDFGEMSKDFFVNIFNISGAYTELLKTEFQKAFKRVDISHIPEDQRVVVLKAALDAAAAKKEWDSFTTGVMYDWAQITFGIDLRLPREDENGPTPDQNNNNKQKEKDKRWQNAIDAIKKYNDAYNKFRKNNDAVTASAKTWKFYGKEVSDAAQKAGLSISQYLGEDAVKLTTLEGTTAALERLKQITKYEEDKKKAGEIILGISIAEDDRTQDELLDTLSSTIDEMFSGYEISVELDKLHMQAGFGETFFGVDSINIAELRKKIAESESEFRKYGDKGVEEYKKYLDKVDDLEIKSQQERLKKYINFSREAIGERAKIMLDSFYESQEIEKAFQMTNTMALNKGLIDENIKSDLDSAGKSISDLLQLSDSEIMNDWFITEDQIALLREFNAELQRQRDLTKEGSNQKTKTELDKEAWKRFQTTDTFQMLMSDLENMSEAAIGKMIEQLEQYKEQWKDMPVSDIKQLVDTIEKLKDAQAAFKTPRELKRVLEGYLSEGVNVQDEETGITTATYHFDSVADAQSQLVDSELRIQALEEELALVEQIETLRTQGLSDAEILNQLKSQGLRSEEAISNALGKSSKGLKDNIKEENNRKTAASKVVGVTEDIQASYKEQAERIKKVQDLTNSLFEGWEAINSLFEDDSISSFLLDMSSSILDGVLNMIMLQGETFAATVAAEGLGAAINAAMGPIGWIVLAIQVLTKALKFAFEQHDKNLQEQIDAQQEKVEKLQKAYEKLERQIEKAYMSADLGRLTREAEENLQRQINATEKMIALEEDKKKTDKDTIKDWKDDIDDMRESIEELHEETFSTLTDGVLDNVLDATRGFVDAWHDAFLETGDGAKGLEESFKDMMQNIVRQQASMTILSPFIDQLKGKLNQYVNTYDTMLDPAEAADLKQWFENNKDSMNESLEAYFGAFNSLFDGSGELSDLEKGIQGMTEDQAEVLAAYWNSCRFMLSNIDTTLTRMAANVLDTSGENNPIVAALNAQTEVITAIKDMFSSVIETGNGVQHNGAYLKVFMP